MSRAEFYVFPRVLVLQPHTASTVEFKTQRRSAAFVFSLKTYRCSLPLRQEVSRFCTLDPLTVLK